MTVVVAYTPNEQGRSALEYVLDSILREGEKVVVLNAGRRMDQVESGFASAEDLQSVTERLEQASVVFEIEQIFRENDPDDEIIDYLTTNLDSVRLVAVGMRQRSPVGKLFLGSTAQRIIMHSPVPVVCVRANQVRS